MTIYGTPGGTPLNTTPFQGTAPGNPALTNVLQIVSPGVGMFPPNSNNASGDTIMASVSRGGTPANVVVGGAGASIPTNASILGRSADFGANGYGAGNAGGVFNGNDAASGGAGLGAGGQGQTNGPSGGATFGLSSQLPTNVIVAAIPLPPQFEG